MAEDIRVGGGYIDITSRVDEDGVRRDAHRVGDDYEREFSRTVTDKSKKDDSFIRRAFNNIGSSILSGLKGVVTEVLPVLGAVLNGVLAFAPAMVHAAVATAHFTTAAAGALPVLISLYAQLQIAKLVIKSFGPAILKSMSPVVDAFKAARDSAAELATAGLKPLSAQFVKLNMPAISAMMNSLARSTNKVVAGFLAWSNTAPGVAAIGRIAEATSGLIARLAGPLRDVGISFVAMLGRISLISSTVGGKGLAGALGKVKDVLDGITAATVSKGIFTIVSAFRTLQHWVSVTTEVFKTALGFYRKFRTEIGLVSDALGILSIVFGGPVIAIVAGIGIIIRHWDQLKKLVQGAKEWFGGIQGGSDILDRLKLAALQVWDALKGAFNSIRDATAGPFATLIDTIQQKVIPAFANFYIALAPIASALITVLGPAIGFILKLWLTYANGILTAISYGLRFMTWLLQVGPAISTMVTTAVAFFQSLPGKIGAALAALPGIILATLKKVASDMLYWAGYAVGAYIKFLVTLPSKAASAVAGLWRAISGAFSSARSNAQSSAGSLVSGTINYLKTLPAKAKSAIASLPSRIKSVFSGAGSWLVSAGANILRGLVNGMKGAVGAAVNAAVGAAKSVISGLKAGLGIHSPSIVAEKEVGAYVMPGVAKGILKSLPSFLSSIQNAAPPSIIQAAKAPVAPPGVLRKGNIPPGMIKKAPTKSPSSGGGADITNNYYSTTNTIGTLNMEVAGYLDPSNPAAARKLIAKLYAELAAYEKSYA